MGNTLDQQTVLVVGGSAGIGLAVAQHAQREGARVIVASRSASERQADFPESLKSIEACSFDITDKEEREQLFATIGDIDHLVVTARSEAPLAPFLEVDVKQAKHAFETKLWGLYALVQTAHRHMNASGSITFTSGIASTKVYRGYSAMALVNSATETLCRTLAVELAPMRVNCVSPGFVEPKPESVQEYARQFPAKRLASQDEITMAYLALMTNPYVTGTVSVVDGGASLI